jgi:hypothetical protein
MLFVFVFAHHSSAQFQDVSATNISIIAGDASLDGRFSEALGPILRRRSPHE